jgi:hypothetical protein
VTIWTDDKVETLKAMWERGATGALIAEAIGMSRSAVVGKAHRLGLTARPNPVATNEERFERMIDLIVDAPHDGTELPIDFAAKQVGLMGQVGRKMWRETMARFGRQLT